MGWMKSCLAVVGLCTVVLVGSCVVGFAGLKGTLDPQSASGRIEGPITKVRQATYEYLDGANDGSFAERADVDQMSDGTVQLHIGKADPYDMTMSVAFEQEGATATRVTATYNADRLAWSQPEKVMSTNLHRCLRDDFDRFVKSVHKGRDGGRLDLDDLIVRSRSGNRELSCDVSKPAMVHSDRIPSAHDFADRIERESYAPSLAPGGPNPSAGHPTTVLDSN